MGYWALDNYNKHVQIWEVSEGNYYVISRYIGNWQTFAGALSPGLGVVQPDDASGTMKGGYSATFNATSCTPASGNIEPEDFGGDEADIMLGRYNNSQTGSTPVSFLSEYCPGYSNFHYNNWGWTYQYRNQTWNNFDYGTTGDIVIP